MWLCQGRMVDFAGAISRGKDEPVTVFQTIVTSCLIRTLDVSVSAHDWTHRENIACTGLLPGPSLSRPCQAEDTEAT